MARETAISHRLALFGAPDILIVSKYMGSIGKIFQDFPHRVALFYKRLCPGIAKVSAGRSNGPFGRPSIISLEIGKLIVRIARNGGNFQKWQRCIWNPKRNSSAGSHLGDAYLVGLQKCRLAR